MSPSLLLILDGIHLLLDPSAQRLGARTGSGEILWSRQPIPMPVRAVLAEADVGYLHMWSGVLEVALPAGGVCWVVDGDEQPVRVRLGSGQPPALEWF